MKSNRFSKDAVTYACKKMSSFTSDVRKLLDVLKRALQNKQQGIISLNDMFQSWRNFAEQSGELWLQKLPEFYRNIINIIKDQGGFTTLDKVQVRMSGKEQYKQTQTLEILKKMEQMSIIGLKQKNKKGLRIYEVTLLKI